jgi:hypothetical protein
VRPYVHGTNYVNINRPTGAGRGDYAMNAGDANTNGCPNGDTYGPGSAGGIVGWTECIQTNGLVAVKSQYKLAAVKDGASNTYLIGERYLNPDHYETGKDHNDDQNLYLGFDRDNVCYARAGLPPLRDQPGYSTYFNWGSSHAGVFYMSMCDGSVRNYSYTIDLEIHRRLGNRADGLTIDGSKL